MTLDPQALTAAALLEKARAYRPYNVLNDGALVQSLVAMIDDLQIKLALAGPLYSARQLQPKLDEAYAALEPLARIADIFDHVAGNRPREGDIMSWVDHRVGERTLTVEMLRDARSVLENRKMVLADANSKSPIQAREE